MCDSLGISFDKEVSKTKHLYAIGSILMGYQNAVVWGSGFGYMRPKSLLYSIDNKIHKLRHSLDVRAVRGSITREILLSMGYECPEIYGDPAILLPLFFPKERTHEQKYVVIPHYSKLLSPEYKDRENALGSFKKDWKEFVDCILQSDFVISSSLHGIIIAEAYGIPAVMLHDTPSQDITKYKDWYYSTNRDTFPIADSVEDALNMTPNPPDKSTLKMMQKNLLDTFPKDLWE